MSANALLTIVDGFSVNRRACPSQIQKRRIVDTLPEENHRPPTRAKKLAPVNNVNWSTRTWWRLTGAGQQTVKHARLGVAIKWPGRSERVMDATI